MPGAERAGGAQPGLRLLGLRRQSTLGSASILLGTRPPRAPAQALWWSSETAGDQATEDAEILWALFWARNSHFPSIFTQRPDEIKAVQH